MDEVPIVRANPVNIIINKPPAAMPKGRSHRILGSIKNFFVVMPLAAVVLFQLYKLGQSFAQLTTFPLTSTISYLLAAFLAVLLFLTQMTMRSIIYSTAAGVALIGGMFSVWFGDFWVLIAQNAQNAAAVLSSSFSHREIPFNLLVSGGMALAMIIIAAAQFILSLLVKSFFEILFGKEWGDGRYLGYIAAAAMLLGVQLSYYGYIHVASANKEQQQWVQKSHFMPPERFITKTPGAVLYDEKYVYTAQNNCICAYSLDKGELINKRDFVCSAVHLGFQKCDMPVFVGENAFEGYYNALSGRAWQTPFPTSFEGVEDEEAKINGKPLTTYFTNEGKTLLARFEYGFWGAYNVNDGKMLWLKRIDEAEKGINRTSYEKYLEETNILEVGQGVVISCNNAVVKRISLANGKTVWSYEHPNQKLNGKSLMARLSLGSSGIIASYRSGEVMCLNPKTGLVESRAKKEDYVTAGRVIASGTHGLLLSEVGVLYNFELDGGKLIKATNVLPQKSEFAPILQDLEHGVASNGGKVIKISGLDCGVCETVLELNKRVFAAQPVFLNKLMFIGTEDGWVYCVHIGSMHEKWHVHTEGGLERDSLKIIDDFLLVKTKSGSLYRFKTDFI